jgi:hypothetical protein
MPGKYAWLLLPFLLAIPAHADEATVNEVSLRQTGGTWSFSVTLSHGDTGWEDYADGWRVVNEGGAVLGTRVLLHPHVNEQPFTRSLGGVVIPSGIGTVYIETSTITDGWAPTRFAVGLSSE